MSIQHAVSVDDLRRLARSRLPRAVFDFIDGGATDELTLKANQLDFESIRLRPRFLRDVSKIELGTDILGKPSAAPLVIGPTGLATLVWPDGECLLAQAAARAGIPFTLSTGAGNTIEEVSAVSEGRRWFQLYVFKDRSLTESMIARAAQAGYEALVLTVDVPVIGKRDRDRHNGFTIPLRWSTRSILDFALHPQWCLQMWQQGMPRLRNFDAARGAADAQSHAALMNSQLDASLTWDVIAWLRQRWKGALLVKGVLCLDDALRAADHGADAVIISNHGGRQIDGVSSSVRALRQWGAQASARVPLMVDGGFRRGGDIVKALALGARAVLLGRPTLYGVASAGAPGAARCLDILLEEVRITMAHLGVQRVSDINRDCLDLE
jgi:isopentenyl diphosphate isomerase/L-lactate dehydrogenase-like FMN-dependent dehydrogenase